jgi:hypothetical protein
MGRIGKRVKSALSGSPATFENKVGLSKAKLEELLTLFRPLNDFGGDLHDRLLLYVLDGIEDDAALEALAGRKKAANALRLRCASSQFALPTFNENWGGFLAAIESIDARFYLRLGKVFEAAARALPADRFFCQPEFDNALWLEILLQEGTRTGARTWSPEHRVTAISGSLIESMLEADGRSSTSFITAPFRIVQTQTWDQNEMRSMVLRVADLGKTYALHRDLIAPFLIEGTADSRRIAVENLARAAAPASVFIAELAVAATGESKRLREAAAAMLATVPDASRPILEAIVHKGSSTEREHAVRLLTRAAGSGTSEFLAQIREHEKSTKVQQAIDDSLRNLLLAGAVAGPAPIVAEPAPTVELDGPVTAALEAEFRNVLEVFNAQIIGNNDTLVANPPRHPQGSQGPANLIYSPQEIDELCRRFREGGCDLPIADCSTKMTHIYGHDVGRALRILKPLIDHPDLRVIPFVRLMVLLGYLAIRHYDRRVGFMFNAERVVDSYRSSHPPGIGLADLAAGLGAAGLSPDMIALEMFDHWRVFDWDAESVWPYFAGRLALLEQSLAPSADSARRWNWDYTLESVTRILAKFPAVPPSLVGRLWDLALGTVKVDRLLAQKGVERLPDLQDRLATALGSGNYQTRCIAAEWLGRLGDKRAVAALDAAARKEKQDAALDEILTALEKLGEPIEPYLDRKKLQANAEKGLKKGTPEALGWFPWAGLPRLHWGDTGKKIPQEIVTWLIVQNFKLKSAEAGPLLRRYCVLIAPAEREKLARYVLAAWLDQDLLRKHTDAEARKLAQKQAPQTWQSYQQNLQWYQQNNQTPPTLFQATLAQVEEQLYHDLCRECGSAIAEKGILAVAGACGGDATVPPVQKYLKEWFGYRAAQCKALIAMLSGVDRPAAIQYLLSIANRFRTKGIREEAEKYVHLLAERKGWTLDELADRTMPTVGFDDEGMLELNFGPRHFTARVNSDLEAVLSDAAGKVLKNLPEPRQDDDDELAKAAKATFPTSKKELKKFAGIQTTRLYEAMCTERTWPVADWRMYLMGHPLLKFLCQRLVWAVWEGDAVKQTFRPLDDGTLTNYDDGEVVVAEGATIRIAHGCQVSDAVPEGWQKHLADYDVPPLFVQFGRAPYILPTDKRNESSIDEFQGFMVEAFTLRNLATKCGFTRGQAQDAGWFYDYAKTFPGLGLIASLNFSGNGLPEANRQVALKELSFQKSAPAEAGFQMQGNNLPLAEIPAVLLTECYNDLASIARSGSGFDREWKKKVY